MRTRMRFDSREYVRTIKQFQKAMGITFQESEQILFPMRARYRLLKELERAELSKENFAFKRDLRRERS